MPSGRRSTFTPLLATADPGEPTQRGGEVYADIGKDATSTPRSRGSGSCRRVCPGRIASSPPDQSAEGPR